MRRASLDIRARISTSGPETLVRTRAHTDGQGRKKCGNFSGDCETTANTRVWRATNDDDEHDVYGILL